MARTRPIAPTWSEPLQPFLVDTRVLGNPLTNEPLPGQTVTALYRPPSSLNVDDPNQYLTAMTSSDGTAAVILTTGDVVQTRYGLNLPAPSFNLLDPQNDAIVYALTSQSQVPGLGLSLTQTPSADSISF